MKIIRLIIFFLTMTAPTWAGVPNPLLIEIHTAKNFNDQQYEKLMQATRLVELIINSQAFKNRILNFTYQGKREFVQNSGMSNEQIYETLMNGAELFPIQTNPDQRMDFDLVLYKPKWYQSKKVLGYTNRDTSVIHINKYFFNQAEINQIAMNLVHEWTHKLGFEHDFRKTQRRPFTVPYGVGYIIRDLGNKILEK